MDYQLSYRLTFIDFASAAEGVAFCAAAAPRLSKSCPARLDDRRLSRFAPRERLAEAQDGGSGWVGRSCVSFVALFGGKGNGEELEKGGGKCPCFGSCRFLS